MPNVPLWVGAAAGWLVGFVQCCLLHLPSHHPGFAPLSLAWGWACVGCAAGLLLGVALSVSRDWRHQAPRLPWRASCCPRRCRRGECQSHRPCPIPAIFSVFSSCAACTSPCLLLSAPAGAVARWTCWAGSTPQLATPPKHGRGFRRRQGTASAEAAVRCAERSPNPPPRTMAVARRRKLSRECRRRQARWRGRSAAFRPPRRRAIMAAGASAECKRSAQVGAGRREFARNARAQWTAKGCQGHHCGNGRCSKVCAS